MARATGIVLYVEDEETDRFLMARAFSKEGLGGALQMVNDGQAAINYLSGAEEYGDREKHPLPGVVLLDLNLPEVHGFEVLRWIRAHPAHGVLPVVVFSSSARDEDRDQAKTLGANKFVSKPSGSEGFRDVVRQLNLEWLGGDKMGTATTA